MTLTIIVISRERPRIIVPWWEKHFDIHWRVNDVVADPNNTIARVQCIAKERNEAMKSALELYPTTTDVFMLDSYYINQYESCLRLINDYMMGGGQMILSGAFWGIWKTRASHLVKREKKWFDTWGFPECRFLPYGWQPKNDPVVWGAGAKVPVENFYRVETVGSAYIFPLEAYHRTSYIPCNDLSRTEHYWMCHNSGLPCYVDFNVDFYREAQTWPVIECLKHSLKDVFSW